MAAMDPDRDSITGSEELPRREPADHEVAAGAISGLAGGGAAALAALVASDQPSIFPLRLVAASFLGHGALDPAGAAPVLLGAALGALGAVVLGLVCASILPRGLSTARAVAAGLGFGAAAWGVTWFVAVRLLDPVLFAAVPAAQALPLYLLDGAVMALLLPPLRRVLP
jgi:hypothetical protein